MKQKSELHGFFPAVLATAFYGVPIWLFIGIFADPHKSIVENGMLVMSLTALSALFLLFVNLKIYKLAMNSTYKNTLKNYIKIAVFAPYIKSLTL